MNITQNLHKNTWFFLGYFIFNGILTTKTSRFRTNNKSKEKVIYITIHEKYTSILNLFREFLDLILSDSITYKHMYKVNETQYNKQYFELLEQFNNSKGKIIPNNVIPEQHIKEFLLGSYLSSNFYTLNHYQLKIPIHKYNFSTIFLDVAIGIQKLYKLLEINVNIRKITEGKYEIFKINI